MGGSHDGVRRFRTRAGSVLESQPDGSLKVAPVSELIIRPGGTLLIDGGELVVHVSSSGDLEVFEKTFASAAKPIAEEIGSPRAKDDCVVPTGTSAAGGVSSKYYSSREVAEKFFGKSVQWLYWGYRDKDSKGNPVTPVFVHPDGTLIDPMKIGKGKRRRYTLDIIAAMAEACYRRGNLTEQDYRDVLNKIKAAENDQFSGGVGGYCRMPRTIGRAEESSSLPAHRR